MTDPRFQHRLRMLLGVKGLTESEVRAFAGCGLPPTDTLVLAYLRTACHLLARDAALSVMALDQAWADWSAGMEAALDEALRYRSNDALVLAIGAVRVLLLGVYPRARLRGFKALEDAARAAQRGATVLKRERSMRHQPILRFVTSASLWVGPQQEIIPDRELGDARRAALHEAGYREVWGASLMHPLARPTLELIQIVLPVISQRQGLFTFIVPLPEA